MTNQTVTGSKLTGYIVNVMRSPVIERLMVLGSWVALKHVIYDMETRALVMELRRRANKRWFPCGDMDRMLKIHIKVHMFTQPRLTADFGQLLGNAHT